MQTVPIHQAKSQLSELIRAVENGEEVVLTRHGKRVIRLIKEPETEQPTIESRRQAITQELEALRGEPFQELWEEHQRERDGRGEAWTRDPKGGHAGR